MRPSSDVAVARATSRSSASAAGDGAGSMQPWPAGRTGSTCRSTRADRPAVEIVIESARARHRRLAVDASASRAPIAPRRPSGRVATPAYRMSTMDLGLTGARALVGGGSGGLGGAIAAALRAEGAQVGLVARPSDRLDERGGPARRARGPGRPVDARRPGRAVAARRRGVRRARPAGRQLRRPAARTIRRPRRGRLAGRHRRHAVERDPSPAGGPAASARRVATRPSWSSCRARRASRSRG